MYQQIPTINLQDHQLLLVFVGSTPARRRICMAGMGGFLVPPNAPSVVAGPLRSGANGWKKIAGKVRENMAAT